MKQTANKALKKPNSSLTSVMNHHAAIRPFLDHDLPQTFGDKAYGHGLDFSRIPKFNPSLVQVYPKLAVSTPGDMCEQEADRVADLVMRIPDPLPQRACACGGECPPWRKEQGNQQQLQTMSFQGPGEVTGSPVSHEVVSSGEPLDSITSRFMESRFGHDFGKVRVYTDAQSAASAHALNARAYTIGCSIVFGRNQYAPGTTEGRRLLAHELTHVIRQERNLPGVRGPTIQRTVEGDITQMSITPEWAHNLTDKELDEQKRIVQLQISQQRGDIDVARINLGILNNELGQPLRKLERKDDKAAFREWWEPVPRFEGTFEEHERNPANVYDRGGKTNLGVTWDMYQKYAKVLLGLEPTEDNFKRMTVDQAMLFGRMIWKSSGATAIQNTGVAIVLADWYWGGIKSERLSALLAKKGYKASYDEGKPTAATIDFLNTLSPSELVELMSDEKAAQYRAFAKAHPEQQVFTQGQVNRSEKRRQQARPFTISISEAGQRALAEAEAVLHKGADASSEEKSAARNKLWAVVGRIEKQQKMGLSDAEAQAAMRTLKGQLLNRIGKVMDLGS